MPMGNLMTHLAVLSNHNSIMRLASCIPVSLNESIFRWIYFYNAIFKGIDNNRRGKLDKEIICMNCMNLPYGQPKISAVCY